MRNEGRRMKEKENCIVIFVITLALLIVFALTSFFIISEKTMLSVGVVTRNRAQNKLNRGLYTSMVVWHCLYLLTIPFSLNININPCVSLIYHDYLEAFHHWWSFQKLCRYLTRSIVSSIYLSSLSLSLLWHWLK